MIILELASDLDQGKTPSDSRRKKRAKRKTLQIKTNIQNKGQIEIEVHLN